MIFSRALLQSSHINTYLRLHNINNVSCHKLAEMNQKDTSIWFSLHKMKGAMTLFEYTLKQCLGHTSVITIFVHAEANARHTEL